LAYQCARQTGIGIKDKDLTRIFDPFFTTKQEGVGTGLGLAMTYTIIKRHEGFIKVYSEFGTGTSFSMYLPVAAEADRAAIPAQLKDPVRGIGSILVIQDDTILRNAAVRMLEFCGYKVYTAASGAEGTAMVRHGIGQFDMVMLDLYLPDINGTEAFRHLRIIDPGLRILLTSGFYHDERYDEILSSGTAAFIPKPFTLHDLSAAVASVIDSRPSSAQNS
jgi:CheY-like chemotaxis protein